jgi:hypothetical protein
MSRHGEDTADPGEQELSGWWILVVSTVTWDAKPHVIFQPNLLPQPCREIAILKSNTSSLLSAASLTHAPKNAKLRKDIYI